jgi:hypothetical protein
LSRYQHLKSALADFWKEYKQSMRANAKFYIGGTLLAFGIGMLVNTIPSNLSDDLTLRILTALLTSGTVFLPLAGVVLTFALNSTNTRMESLRRDRLAVWVAQQEAYLKAAIENKPEISRRVGDQFEPTLKGYDAQIASLEEGLEPLGSFCATVFCFVLSSHSHMLGSGSLSRCSFLPFTDWHS